LLILGDQALDVLPLLFKLAVSQRMEDCLRVRFVKPTLAKLVISLIHNELFFKARGGFHRISFRYAPSSGFTVQG
jgi:hypothetical protein